MTDIPEQTLAKWREQVEKLLDGWRWCSCCGDVKIDPGLPSYAFKCKPCFDKWKASEGKGEIVDVQREGYLSKVNSRGTVRFQKAAEGLCKYCGLCGEEIPEDKLRFAIFISGGKREASRCFSCSKSIRQPLNPTAPKKNQVFVPDHYMPHAAELLPNYQMSLV